MIAIYHRKYSLMIGYAIVLHYLWAICAVVDSSSLHATALSIFVKTLRMPDWTMPAIFCFVASLAISAMAMSVSTVSVLMMLPQQFTLTVSAWGAAHAAISGHFGDGIERSHAFILADQAPAIIAAIGHTLAIISLGQMAAEWKR